MNTFPGFVDLQINGYRGVDFASPDLTVDHVRQVTQYLLAAGTVAYCPTLVTGPEAQYERNLPVLAEAMQEPDLAPHILGIHLEGPFISPLEGARGAHPPEHIRSPDVRLFAKYQQWAGGGIKIFSMAPELPGAAEFIRQVTGLGVTVSLAHHLAEDDDLAQAVAAGARAVTHLGNGLPNTVNRHQNPLWWLLACDDLWGMFITDGHHLPEDFIRVALRAKTLDRFLVVSDAVQLAGCPPGEYDFQGHPVILQPDGRVSFAGTPYLAGSSANMLACMNHLAGMEVLGADELRQIGFANPLGLLGLDQEDVASRLAPRVTFRDGRFETL
ncbi:MAG: N-acetylglucosamine-6-phosphate deacetylase [Kiritimatiellia bacterium]